MALQQRIEWIEEAAPSISAYADEGLPALIRHELEAFNACEAALPVRSAAQARKLIVSALVGGAAAWALVIEAAIHVARLIA